jgi:hypothetical protein
VAAVVTRRAAAVVVVVAVTSKAGADGEQPVAKLVMLKGEVMTSP